MKIGFIILCYGNYPMIESCMLKLMDLEHIDESEIVLVDNKSPDGTGKKLKEKYKGKRNIHVLLCKENMGFAKGNNVGYQYAKEQLSCDVQVIMNSDVFIDDKLFIDKLIAAIAENKTAAIIGPDVIGKNGRHTNPLYDGPITPEHAKKNILYNKLANILLRCHLDYHRRKKSTTDDNKVQTKKFDIMPHGCCVIYTPAWIANEKQAFWPGTFLFCEEYFLTDYALEAGYKTMYDPDLVVRHLGDGSIDVNNKSNRKKRIFINTKQTESLKQYLEFTRDAKKNWCNNM